MRSFAALSDRLQARVPSLVDSLKNGQCKFLAVGATDRTDDRGFLKRDFAGRTASFLPCIWNVATEDEVREQEIAAKARGVVRYKVVVPKKVNGSDVIVAVSDKMQLKLAIGASSFLTLEVAEVIDQSGINWEIWAVDGGS